MFLDQARSINIAVVAQLHIQFPNMNLFEIPKVMLLRNVPWHLHISGQQFMEPCDNQAETRFKPHNYQ